MDMDKLIRDGTGPEAGGRVRKPADTGARKKRQQETAMTGDGFYRYLKEIRKIRLLSAEEELELARRVAAGDNKARDRMIEANLRLAYYVAKIYDSGELPLEDLVQEANTGLIKAVDRFDPERGPRFSSFAVWHIRAAVTRAIANEGRLVRIPAHLVDEIHRLHRVEHLLRQRMGRKPTEAEIAAEIGCTEERLEILRIADQDLLSLDSPAPGGEGYVLADYLEADNGDGPDELAEKSALREQVRKSLAILPEQERRVLVLRFGLDGGGARTLEEIAQYDGVTRERVRQIETKALWKLRHSSQTKLLRAFL